MSAEVSSESLRRLHKGMLISRGLDQKCFDEFAEWYPAFGEEGVTIGAFQSLTNVDFAVPHYRGSMGVFWLQGMSLDEIIGGLLFRPNSVSLGRLSGLHGGSFRRRILPSVTNVLGPNIGSGVGIAMAEKLRGGPGVVVIGFGDGTGALGTLHETLNLAQIYKLPVLFVCQNNQYSISSRSSQMQSWDSYASWAEGYNVPAKQVDGNDVLAMHEAATIAIARARAGDGPSFIDALTFRQGGHLSTDKAPYQSEQERISWLDRDPIKRLEKSLVESGELSESEITAIRRQVTEDIDLAWARILAMPGVSAGNN